MEPQQTRAHSLAAKVVTLGLVLEVGRPNRQLDLRRDLIAAAPMLRTGP